MPIPDYQSVMLPLFLAKVNTVLGQIKIQNPGLTV